MKRAIMRACALLIAPVLLGGCANYQEMAHMNIVIGLAVDSGENGYALTFEAVDLSGSPETGEMKSFTVKAEGVTIPKALEDAQRRMAYRPHYGNLETVVIHEDVARTEGLRPLLDWCVRDADMRETASLVISRAPSAGQTLEAKGADISVSSYVLEHIVNPPDGRIKHTVRTPLYRVADILSTPGKSLVLPAIAVPAEDEEEGVIRLDGLAVFHGGRLAGYLEQDRVPYYMCLMNVLGTHEFSFDAGGKAATLRVKKSRTRLSVDTESMDGGLPAFRIASSIRGSVRQLSGGAPVADLERSASTHMEKELRRTVEIIQTELGVDALALGYELFIRGDGLWEGLEAGWPSRFPEAAVEIKSDVRISDAGNISER